MIPAFHVCTVREKADFQGGNERNVHECAVTVQTCAVSARAWTVRARQRAVYARAWTVGARERALSARACKLEFRG